MTIPAIIIISILVLITVSILISICVNNSELLFISVLLFLLSLFLSGVITVEDRHELSSATSNKIGSEIFVQSKFPTQIVTDIKYIDQPLRVRKITHYNIYNLHSADLDKIIVEINN